MATKKVGLIARAIGVARRIRIGELGMSEEQLAQLIEDLVEHITHREKSRKEEKAWEDNARAHEVAARPSLWWVPASGHTNKKKSIVIPYTHYKLLDEAWALVSALQDGDIRLLEAGKKAEELNDQLQKSRDSFLLGDDGDPEGQPIVPHLSLVREEAVEGTEE